MKGESELRNTLQRIDGFGYKAYNDIQGHYDFPDYRLFIDHVQGDPFAAPSRVRVRVPQQKAGFDPDLFSNASRQTGLRDYLTRRFHDAAGRFCEGNRGTGKGGIIAIDAPGQEVLERTSVLVDSEYVEARFVMGLPAFGRKIAGRHAEAMFCDELPNIVRSSLLAENLKKEPMLRHVEVNEDADSLRGQLKENECVAFVADNAILPRRSGIDPRPLHAEKAVAFQAPEGYRMQLETPNSGSVTGMGLPRGVTLIVGGGYHGKSTLLSALEMGIYNHLPDDGRAFVVSDPMTAKIRAEDGRRVERVNITPFISDLPFGKDTSGFCTDDASGSTSQAANILEAVEAGASTILIDEDTSATNFMIRDQRMQALVAKEHEPITPFIDKVRQLYDDYGISTVLVIGGAGDYFDVADNVICLRNYLPHDATRQAKEIASEHVAERTNEGGEHFGKVIRRVPHERSLDPRKGKKAAKITERGVNGIQFGQHHIDLGAVEQLVDASQTRALGEALLRARDYMDSERSLREVVDMVEQDIARYGLTCLCNRPSGDFAWFRKLELAAALNRLRTLTVHQTDGQ